MAFADGCNEMGGIIRIRQVMELITNGGAGATIDSITQLIDEMDATFDADATSRRLHPQVIGLLNGWRNAMHVWMARCDLVLFSVIKNRVLPDIDAVNIADDIYGAVGELARYMRDNTEDVTDCAVAASAVTAGGTNTGTGTVKVDVLDAWNEDNNNIQNADYWVACYSDAITGSANQHAELFSVQSSFGGQVDGIAACMYPGSDGTKNNGGGNRLQNKDASTPGSESSPSDTTIPFENFTSNTPDGWTVDTGTPGTDVLDSDNGQAYAYFGNTCLELVGDGSTLLELSQDANDFYGASSTDQALDPLAHYLIGAYMRNETGISAGIVKIYMAGTGYTAGATEIATKDFSSSPPGATWTLYTGVVRMPKAIPSDMKVVIKTTTAISNTHSVGIDGVFLAKMWHIPSFGINVHVVPGSTAFVSDQHDPDRFLFSTTNDWASLWQEMFGRRTDPRDIVQTKYGDVQVALPHAASPSANFAESKCQ